MGTVSGAPSFTVSPLWTGPAMHRRRLSDRGIIEIEPFGAGRNHHLGSFFQPPSWEGKHLSTWRGTPLPSLQGWISSSCGIAVETKRCHCISCEQLLGVVSFSKGKRASQESSGSFKSGTKAYVDQGAL